MGGLKQKKIVVVTSTFQDQVLWSAPAIQNSNFTEKKSDFTVAYKSSSAAVSTD